jgi:hypothetical protein
MNWRDELLTDILFLCTWLGPVIFMDYGGTMPQLQENHLLQLATEFYVMRRDAFMSCLCAIELLAATCLHCLHCLLAATTIELLLISAC